MYYAKNVYTVLVYLLIFIVFSGHSKFSALPLDCAWWKKHVFEDNLIHWLSATQSPRSGFFRVDLDRSWVWSPPNPTVTTPVCQGRLAFDFSSVVTFPFVSQKQKQTSSDQAISGGLFLLQKMKDHQYGGFYLKTTENGTIVDDSKYTYAHAFTIFGFAHLYSLTNDHAWLDSAISTWNMVKVRMRDSDAYSCKDLQHRFNFTFDCITFYQKLPRDFSSPQETERSQNPMMHMFEALLTLYEITKREDIKKDAITLVNFIMNVLYQKNPIMPSDKLKHFIPELYDTSYNPLALDQGGYVMIGHQFEWAYLLSRSVMSGMLTPASKWNNIAWHLLETGLEAGYDDEHGGIYSRTDYSGTPLPQVHASAQAKNWWSQNELIRALMHFGAFATDTSPIPASKLWYMFNQSLDFSKSNLIDADYGGWYELYDPLGTHSYNKGNVWKIGYHVTSMCLEALELCQ